MKVNTIAVTLDAHWLALECDMCGCLALVSNMDLARGASRMHMAVVHKVWPTEESNVTRR